MSNIPSSFTDSSFNLFTLAISSSDPWPFSLWRPQFLPPIVCSVLLWSVLFFRWSISIFRRWIFIFICLTSITGASRTLPRAVWLFLLAKNKRGSWFLSFMSIIRCSCSSWRTLKMNMASIRKVRSQFLALLMISVHFRALFIMIASFIIFTSLVLGPLLTDSWCSWKPYFRLGFSSVSLFVWSFILLISGISSVNSFKYCPRLWCFCHLFLLVKICVSVEAQTTWSELSEMDSE